MGAHQPSVQRSFQPLAIAPKRTLKCRDTPISPFSSRNVVLPPMKILVINWQDWTNPLSGGAETHLHETFKRVAAMGHEVTLFCSRFEGAPAEEVIDGIRIV